MNDSTKSKFTVFFEEPFWVGVYEREDNGKYEACKVIFGSEPKNFEVYGFLLKNWHKMKFSPSIESKNTFKKCANPKRMQRSINKQLTNFGIETKAQQALKLMREQNKLERKSKSRQEKEAERERQFELRQEKRKAKHRGH